MPGVHHDSIPRPPARRLWLSSVMLATVLSSAVILTAVLAGSAVSGSTLVLGATLVGSVLGWANVDRLERPALERRA